MNRETRRELIAALQMKLANESLLDRTRHTRILEREEVARLRELPAKKAVDSLANDTQSKLQEIFKREQTEESDAKILHNWFLHLMGVGHI